MAKQKITQVTVSGLATNPNPNALPVGSCAVAENVVSRRPGVLTPLPANRVVATYSTSDTPEDFPWVPVKFLWDEAVKSVVAVVKAPDAYSVWDPTLPFEQNLGGRLVAYSITQRDEGIADQQWELNDLPAPEGVRYLGFIPGLTHSNYSHFRTFISEKWGVIASGDMGRRWAGLIPPYSVRAFTQASETGWLLDGNSVLYRFHFSLESTILDKPYEVIGPVSSPTAVFASTNSDVSLFITFAANEPLPPINPAEKLFINIYRSTQADVESWTTVPWDFLLIKKIEITAATIAAGQVAWVDQVSVRAREKGAPLYTNEGQKSEEANGLCPPCSRDIAVYRDTVFYANRASLPSLAVQIPGPFVTNTGQLFSDLDRATGIGTRNVTFNVINGDTAFTIPDPSHRLGVTAGQEARILGAPYMIGAFDQTTGQGYFTEPYTRTGSGTLPGIVNDMYALRVRYADGTIVDVIDDLTGSDPGINPVPGMRVSNLQPNYPLAAEGITLTWQHTFPAYKRVVQFELFLTNGQNYSPPYQGDYIARTEPLISLGDTRPNRLFFSRTGQPEAVPTNYYIDVGAGTILKCWTTEAALLVLTTDGLWRVTGDDRPWQVNQVDPTVLLVHPDCVASLNNKVYAWVEDGLAELVETGANVISTDALGQDIRSWHTQVKKWGAPYLWGPALAGDFFWNELWLNIRKAGDWTMGHSEFTTTVIFNSDSKNFTRQSATEFHCLLYSPAASRLITATTDRLPTVNTVFNLTVQTDFDPLWAQHYQPVTIWFNPIQTEDKSNLKQWMDVILFINDVDRVPLNIGNRALVSFIKAMFDPRATCTDNTDESTSTRSMLQLSRDIHYWVPRRATLSDQLQIGFRLATSECCNPPEFLPYGFRFQLQGFSVRYRVASDTLKR